MNFCKVRNIPCYGLRWEATSNTKLQEIAVGHAEENGFLGEIHESQSLSELYKRSKLSDAIKGGYAAVKEGRKTFLDTQHRARMTGKMLAHFLAGKNPIFKDCSVSLMGYSLGSAVCMSTIRRLHRMSCHDVIHNVTFLAGATYVRLEKVEWQKEVFSAVVNGRVMNVFSKEDSIVSLFGLLTSTTPLGRNEYFASDPENAAGNCACTPSYRFENYDVSKFVDSHLSYRKTLDQVLEFIHYES